MIFIFIKPRVHDLLHSSPLKENPETPGGVVLNGSFVHPNVEDVRSVCLGIDR